MSIAEFLAINEGMLRDEDQESPGWVEVCSSGPATVNFNGWHLTDDAGSLSKWTFPATNLPAGGYLVVFASAKNRAMAGRPLHTNFKLAGHDGYLALVQANGTTVASVYDAYPSQRANVSYGRNNTSALRYSLPATPGAANGTGYLGLVNDTKFSVGRGFYDAPFAVAITSAATMASIYWTTNGSVPSPTNGTLYTGPVSIPGTRLLRAAAFLTSYIPSVPDTHSYIFLGQVLMQSSNQPGYPTVWQGSYPADYGMDPNVVNHTKYGLTISNDLRSIPPLSLVSDFASFWDPTTGIYVDALNDRGERAVSAELFNGNGTSQFQINCAVQMHGQAGRDNLRCAKHSMRLEFKGDYGPSRLNYDWFGGGVTDFNGIILRAS